jgi:large subunit ribosomal protein L19
MISAHPKYDFRVGDTIDVGFKIQEGEKYRIQHFAGVVIAMKGKETSRTFTVRKIGANQIGVERIFPLYSPLIDSIKIVKAGKARRAKLYYLRSRTGKKALKVKDRV